MGMNDSSEKDKENKEKKKTHSIIKFVVVISLVAFTTSTIMTTTMTSQAYAQTNDRRAVSETISIDGAIIDSTFCEGGELIELSGNIHTVSRIVVDEETGAEHFLWHSNWQGGTGVGLTTGSEYRVKDTLNNPHNFQNVPGGGSDTAVESFTLISQGNSAPDLHIHALFRVTLNAAGETTSEIVNFRAECR